MRGSVRPVTQVYNTPRYPRIYLHPRKKPSSDGARVTAILSRCRGEETTDARNHDGPSSRDLPRPAPVALVPGLRAWRISNRIVKPCPRVRPAISDLVVSRITDRERDIDFECEFKRIISPR